MNPGTLLAGTVGAASNTVISVTDAAPRPGIIGMRPAQTGPRACIAGPMYKGLSSYFEIRRSPNPGL
jgi:hypothetical protein